MQTRSEELFEKFLLDNDLPFERIKEADTRRPDYSVSFGAGERVIFEIKELTKDDNFGVMMDPARPQFLANSRILGDHVRRRIDDSKKQIRWGSDQGIASVLLIYNNLDPLQLFGTENMDFVAAIWGEPTLLINKETSAASELFHGRNQKLQKDANTSFSGIGRLCDRGGDIAVTLFKNRWAKIAIPDNLPSCFDVKSFTVSNEPIALP